jgi:CubicO group peptidase (beta-lactamase class C family)
VLNFDLNFGLGYGLSGGMVPIGPRACFWGGFGGSLIVMDQEAQLTVSYMMNKMAPELLGDLRGFALALTAGAAAVA